MYVFKAVQAHCINERDIQQLYFNKNTIARCKYIYEFIKHPLSIMIGKNEKYS